MWATMKVVTSDGDMGTLYSLRVTTRQWQVIDRTLDSEVSIEAEKGDPGGLASLGHSIREAGWDQVAHWTPGVPGSGSWPPDDEVVSVSLSDTQWSLVCDSLRRWASVSDQLGDVDSATTSRAVCDLVVAQMDEHVPGWGAT